MLYFLFINVLLFPREGELVEAKVSDFGVAKRIGVDNGWWSQENRFLGCSEIMSPESVSRGILLEGHDVWAVGCLVLEMCTNKPLWSNYNILRILSVLARNMAPNIPPTLPDNARDFVSLCLAIDPEERGTISQLLEHPFVMDQEV